MRTMPAFLFAAALGLAALPSAEATGFGVNAHIPSDELAERMADARIEWARIDFLWSIVEPERDAYDWSVYDALVDRLEARGIRIYAGIGATPAWATTGPEFSGVPEDPNQWRELCYLAARRYAGRIDAWGPWNEPNLERFWDGTRQQYLDLILVPAIDSIRLADPTALIAAPDLAHLSSANWDDWLDDVVSAVRDRIDVVTHHVYPSEGFAFEVTYDLETGGPLPISPPSVEEVLEDAGWGDRPFWLTETGVESERWGESRQASFVANLLEVWFAPTRGHRDWIDRVFFYELADAREPAEHSFGLLNGPPDLEPKLAFDAYVDFIAAAEVDDAELAAPALPRFFDPAQVAVTELSYTNTGTTTWNLDGPIGLAAQIDSSGWLVEVELTDVTTSVVPGETATFKLIVTAPGSAAKNIGELPVLSARLERSGYWRFGDAIHHQIRLVPADPPVITGDPTDLVLVRGATGNLSVAAGGAAPLSYQWLRNGVPLSDGALFSGSATDTLTVRALSHQVAGFYQCLVANDIGDVASGAATITLGLPAPRTGTGRVVPPVLPPPAAPVDDLPRLTGPGAGQSPSEPEVVGGASNQTE